MIILINDKLRLLSNQTLIYYTHVIFFLKKLIENRSHLSKQGRESEIDYTMGKAHPLYICNIYILKMLFVESLVYGIKTLEFRIY